MLKKLNLGCGKDIRKDCLNVDCIKYPGVDVVWDLDKFPWPFADNSFSEVYARHIIEHLNDFKKTLEEIRRISTNGAKVFIVVPHFSFVGAYWDPTHKRFFSFFTFDYLEKGVYGLPIFRIKNRKLNFTGKKYPFLNYIFNPFINLSPLLYERFFAGYYPLRRLLLN